MDEKGLITAYYRRWISNAEDAINDGNYAMAGICINAVRSGLQKTYEVKVIPPEERSELLERAGELEKKVLAYSPK